MQSNHGGRVVIAHRRAPVLRMIRANLEAEGIAVDAVMTATACTAALAAHETRALVLDADLVRDTVPGGEALLAHLRRVAPPVLLLSWDPADRSIARQLGDAPFLSRPDDIDRVVDMIHGLLEPLLPV